MILCSFSPCPDDALLAREATYRKRKRISLLLQKKIVGLTYELREKYEIQASRYMFSPCPFSIEELLIFSQIAVDRFASMVNQQVRGSILLYDKSPSRSTTTTPILVIFPSLPCCDFDFEYDEWVERSLQKSLSDPTKELVSKKYIYILDTGRTASFFRKDLLLPYPNPARD